MWDALNGELLYELGEPTEVVSSVAFSPKESIVAASLSQIPPSSVPGNSSTRVQLWDLSSQQPISPALGTTAYKISFSPEGDSLLTSGYSGAELWDIATGQMLRRFSATEDRMIDAAFSPMGNMVATVGTDGNVIIWNTATAEELKRVEYTPALTSLAFSPTGNAVAFGGEDHLVQIWDIENGTRLRWLSGHQAPVTEIAFSQDGRYIVTGDEHDAPRLWTSEGAFLRSLGEELQDIDDIVFGPGSKIVAATEKTYSEGNVQVWDTETGALLQQLTYSSTLTALAFHPLNQLIATASQDRLVRIWDLGSGEISRTLAGHFQTVTAALAFSPDGSTLASGAYGEILLWNMNTFVSRSIHEEGLQYIPGITFSHDGELLASPANDNDIHIWSVKTGQLLRTLEGHQGNVLALAFSPDGRWLAASATDGTARIWGISSN
jgi:WD40 repeat protein